MEFEATYLVIGNLQIRYYGIIVVVALLAGAYVASFLVHNDSDAAALAASVAELAG